MKFLLLIIAVIVALVAAAPLAEDQYQFLFTRFVQQYNKQYEANDFFGRYNIFKSNLNKIVAHNSRAEQWTMAVNQFADLSEVEFMSTMGFKPVAPKAELQQPCPMSNNSPLKFTYVDWREKNVLNAVKDQGSCGSCWAFSANQALEAAYAMANGGKMLDLSEQQLVDCDTQSSGCNGGLMNNAYDYLMGAGGACLTQDYPYTARDGTCQRCAAAVKVNDYVTVKSGDAALNEALVGRPIAVALAATSAFQFYSKGVFTQCSSTSLNHGVGLVGLVQAEKDAWVIRNSWGASWGQAGHILLDATQPNCLGMSVTAAKWNVYPIV